MLEHEQLHNMCALLTAGSKNKWNALTCQVRWLTGIFESLRSKESLLGKFSLLARWQQVVDDMQLALRNMVSPEHFYQQIRQLETRYRVELGDKPIPYIRVNFGTVYLLDKFNMGEFAVDFIIGETGSFTTRIVHIGQLAPGMNSHTPHPHISGSAFCAGADGYTFSSLLETGELVEYVTLLEQLLHTYNPNGAFILLLDERCSECDRYYELSKLLNCQCCGNYVCDNCGFGVCKDCQREICSGCATPCCLCSKTICIDCLTAWCAKCHDGLCDACAGKCTPVGVNQYICFACKKKEEREKETALP